MNEELPSESEIEQAAQILAKLPRGHLPFSLFIQVTRLVTTPTIELAPIRMRGEEPEIYLTQRPADDPYWPSGWHIPGTVIRSTDEEGDFRTGFDRVKSDELGPAFTYKDEPVYVTTKFWDVLRGRELDAVHYVRVEVDDTANLDGKFFTQSELPAATLEHHKILIAEIFDAYVDQ